MRWAAEERKVCERSVGKLGGMRKRGCRMFVMAGGRMGGMAERKEVEGGGGGGERHLGVQKELEALGGCEWSV